MSSLPRRAIRRAVIFPLLLAGLTGTVSAADGPDVEARLEAAFIYNFARFVDWPARTVPGSVRIGILGRGDLAAPLREVIVGKLVNGRPIEVTNTSSAADAGHFEILLIERSESKHIKDIVQALAGKPVLTVCQEGNCFRDGAMIAFQVVDESVRFQINQESAEQAGLKISSQILKVALSSAVTHR